MFSVRLVIADSYQASPLIPFDLSFSEFRNFRIKNVPTIRIFGSTLTGEKVCLHIHGVFPYIYVPYVGGDNPEDFAHRLAKSLDYVINVSLGSAGTDTQHVYKIQQVKGLPYYGYHEKLHHYFKIYFYNPAIIKRAAELLQNGSVLNQTLQPHEAHIPFILQFMIDYNIYGMSLINLKDVKYRQANRRGPDGKLNNETLTPYYKSRDYLPPTVKKQSICEIEIDAWASDILNKEAIEKGIDVNPGLAAIWDEERARRMLAGFEGGDSQLGPPNSPLRSNLPPTDNDLLQMQRFQRKLTFVSQDEESSVSINSDSFFYPVEVNEGIKLLDASHLERHVGPKNNKNKLYDLSTSSDTDISLHFDATEELRVNLEGVPLKSKSKSIQLSGEESSYDQNRTLDQSIFDAEDLPLVDILEQLAEGHNTDEQVEEDSILGSHCSAVLSECKSDEEVENDVPDLNFTAFEIDNLSLNLDLTPTCSGNSKNSNREKPGTSFALHPLSFENVADEKSERGQKDSQDSLNIPQFDGADDLPRKRNSSGERSTSRKKRKIGNENKDISAQALSDLNKKVNNLDKELRISSSSESISEMFKSELDRTIIPEENDIGIISETSESTENPSGNADKDFTLVVEEKLICNYKSGKKISVVNRRDFEVQKERFKDQERKLKCSSLLQSPRRASKSPKKSLKSPSRRSPRKSLQSPRRNYSSLNIIVTPSKRRKELEKQVHGISKDDESSGDAIENKTLYFTQKRVTKNTLKAEACCSKVNEKLALCQKERIIKNSDQDSKNPGTSRKLTDYQKSETSDDEIFLLSQNSQVEQNSKNEICKDVFQNINLFNSKRSRTHQNLKDELFLSKKSQFRKSSPGEVVKESPNRKLFSQKPNDGKGSEIEIDLNSPLLSQKSQERKTSEDEMFFLSQNSENEICKDVLPNLNPFNSKKSRTQKNLEDDKLCLTQKSQFRKSSPGKGMKKSPNRKLFSQKSNDEKGSEIEIDLNSPLLSQKSQERKTSEDEMFFLSQISENEICKDVLPNLNPFNSKRSRTQKNLEDDEKDDELFLTQKSQFRKSSPGKSVKESPNRKLFSQKSNDEKSSEFEFDLNLPFFSQKSQERNHSEDDGLQKIRPSDENVSLSRSSTDDKCLADDESSEGSLHEIPLAQKPTSETGSQNEMNSLSKESNIESKSNEINLLVNLDNISPLLGNDKIYDEETDSSDFEESLEILLKNVSPDSKNKNVLSTPSKLTEEMIEDQNTSNDDTLKAEDVNDLNLDIAEEVNNEVCDAKNLLTVTFSEFTNTELNSSYKLTRKSISNLQSNRLVAITTKFCAPTRQHIIDSMNIYGIPTYRNQEPFYSNRNDIRQHKDTAYQIINKKEVAEFPPFKSEIGGVVGIKLWRRMKVNEFHSSSAKLNTVNIKKGLAERRLITITPLHLPPDRKNVIKWIKTRKRLKRKEEKIEEFCPKEEKVEKKCKNPDECNNTEINKDQKENKSQEVEKGQQENKNEKEDKGQSENSGDCAKSSPLALFPLSKELDNSGNKTRESIGNNSSLFSTLRPSELLTVEKKKGKKLRGVSFGQIDFSMDETKSESDIANQNLQNAKAITTYQYLTILCLEVHVTTRKNFLPDPQHDRIEAVFYVIHNDVPPNSNLKRLEQGAIIVDLNESRNLCGLYPSCKIKYVTCEEDLFCNVISLISDCNPDILIGWELETLSWGYIFQRAGHLGTNLASTISRIPGSKCSWESHAVDLEALEAEIKLPGRIVLDIWRIMRHEIALLSYTFENVMYHVMHKRLSCPSFKTLTEWWHSKVPCLRWRVMDFYVNKNLGIIQLLEQLDIIGRTCEHARLFGIQFFEVFSRGSQFRVESMMFRLAKPFNYILVSPSVRQRAAMRAPEALPLILEPISTFYSDPVIVLDFQSLYPSIIIAYNYCFTTCVGRVEHLGQRDPYEFGCTTLKVPKQTALKLNGKINFSPVGIGFVNPEIRKGVVPRMLSEILNTRLMVKKAMKDHPKDDRPLQQVLHNRQLGLKLIANVTYGYTSANFSGRMPCIELADSIVSKGKETLQRAIKMVEDTPKWGGRVVYGDTDSLFVLLYGKSRNEAFKIGSEIADAVTAANPTPVKLKFEKVLHPCILQTKKRYCGYSYETIDNEKPEYLAKGIETVRRDGCPASAKILEKTLKILFDTKDVSQVKQYVTRQLDKIFQGTVSIQDLTFAREFRGLRGYSKNACVPALELTRRLMKKDPRAVPRNSERVPYIIVAGAPNEALIHSVRSPRELLADPSLRPNAIYYITRVVIPPLNRCLNLLGADVHIWFRDMPHREVLNKAVSLPSDKQKATISQFFSAHVCLSCGNSSESNICKQCVERPCRTIIILHEKLRSLEKNAFNVDVICRSCTGQLGIPDCESLDCPVTYRRSQVEREYALAPTIRKIIDDWQI